MQQDSAEDDYRRTPNGLKWFRYVPLDGIADYESRGWKVVDFMADTHHGDYSVLCQWMGEGEPK